MEAAVALLLNEPGVEKHTEVFRHRGEGHLERLGQLGDGARRGGEAAQNGPARSVCQSRLNPIEMLVRGTP